MALNLEGEDAYDSDPGGDIAVGDIGDTDRHGCARGFFVQKRGIGSI